jgi:hypothetical protein
MPVTIREFDEADTDAVIALWQHVFPEYGDASRPHRARVCRSRTSSARSANCSSSPRATKAARSSAR